MQDQSEKWLKVLGLAPGATEQAVRDAYRDLVKVWHPDRFGSDARLREKAEERLRELNDAFAHLQNYRPDDSRADRPSATRSNTTPDRAPFFAVAGTRLSISARMAATLIVSAVIAAAAVWLVLTAHRAAAPPPPQDQSHAPAAFDQSRAIVPVRRAVSASREKSQTDSPAQPTTGSLRVESQPTGARISFDGEAIGVTPLGVTDVAPGEQQIGLDLDARGYQRWSSSVVVSAGREEKLLAVMTPNAPGR